MDMVQLRYFQIAAREGNFSRAAELLHVAQPALSVSISRLEKELGVNLFDRRGKKVVLNPCGSAFLQYADRALSDFDKTLKHIHRLQSDADEQITIAASSFMSIQPLVIAYKTIHNHMRISQYSVMVSDIPSDLKRGLCDFIVATHPVTDPELESEVILHQKIGLIVPAGHPFAEQESIDLIDAKDEPFVCMQKNTSFRKFTDEVFEAAGYTPIIAMEYFQSQLLQLVEEGIGIGIGVWYNSRALYFQGAMRFLPIRNPNRDRLVYLCWQKSRSDEKKIHDFVQFAMEYYADPSHRP